MIRIGYILLQKRQQMEKALDEYKDVDRIYVFHGDKEPPNFDFEGYETIYVSHPESQMYRTFYPLLGNPYKGQEIPAITDKSLLVVDEIMVNTNRSDLSYNCIHHFLHVSPRHMVFSYFPFTSEEKDFMILMDMDKPDIYKNQTFNPDLLKDADFEGIRRLPEISSVPVSTTEKERKRYEEKKELLFENIGLKDPDTIPRNLALTAGDAKKKSIQDDCVYVARNGRFKKPNVFTYSSAPKGDEYRLLDMHYRLKDFENFIRYTGVRELVYMETELPVDKVYLDFLNGWYDRTEEFYEKTGIH